MESKRLNDFYCDYAMSSSMILFEIKCFWKNLFSISFVFSLGFGNGRYENANDRKCLGLSIINLANLSLLFN
ncbi:hypothetical protein QVD17_04183 [Tagetes erecta]|uniref:Uncharacterized protein n=1 Tax=Tagetes erecta TaxID=13708 RepID=A0AAD8P442_TARER|nr:hypothetical protein QVD17_04183 [Tagetes erecta]